MPTAEISITIDRPVEDVFDYAVAVEHLAEWVLVIKDAWPTSTDQTMVGATYMVEAKIGAKVMEIPSEVIAYERNRVYGYQAKGSMPYVSTKLFERTKSGTRVTERLKMEREGYFSRLMAPMMLYISKRSHQKSLELLKTNLESAETKMLAQAE